jgi:hypothetical protein
MSEKVWVWVGGKVHLAMFVKQYGPDERFGLKVYRTICGHELDGPNVYREFPDALKKWRCKHCQRKGERKDE